LIISLGNEFNSLTCQAWTGLGATYPIADDRGSGIWSEFGNGATPRNAIIDSDGMVHYNSIGFNQSAVTAILNDLLTVTGTEEAVESPEQHHLLSVYPNPFNAETQIKFKLPTASHIALSIYDGSGRLVRKLLSSELPKGSHTVAWNTRNESGAELPSGVYIATLAHRGHLDSQKILLLK